MEKVGNPDKEKAFGSVKVFDDRMITDIDRTNRELEKAKSRSKEKPIFKVEGIVTDLWKCSTGVVAMLVLLGVLAANTDLGKYFEGGALGGMMSATGNALGFAASSSASALVALALIALAYLAFRKRRK